MRTEKDGREESRDAMEFHELSRRGFLKIVGVFTLGATGAGLASCGRDATPIQELSAPASLGYILVDSRKCQGCLTCMIACSLVQEGCVNLSMARIQVINNPLGCYPDNVRISQCRQCEEPRCVYACPTGALVADEEHGNIRRIRPERCIGCGQCILACPHEPKKPMVAPDMRYGGRPTSRKCDLCLNAPHHFAPNGGGVEGVRACEAVCPLGAIQFATVMPVQEGDEGYDVNLRNWKWALLNYSIT